MKIFKGFVYSKHRLVGTKSEGEVYILQTYNGEYIITSDIDLLPFQKDKLLTNYVRKMVEIDCEDSIPDYDEKQTFSEYRILLVKSIKEINDGCIPRK